MTEKVHKDKSEIPGKKKHLHRSAGKAKPAAGHQEIEKIREDLRAKEEAIKEWHDKYLRLSAEFDNYRKRTLKEKAEMIKTASEGLLEKFIPFIDDIERGMNAMNTSQDMNAVKEGMGLIYGRFVDFLKHHGVKEIEALHHEFNTDLHEAVTKIPAGDEKLKGKVVDVIQKGYLLHEKVIRYPKVVVGE
jgi:molecular chaperone GrpE